MTVRNFIKLNKGDCKVIWVCPHIVENQSVTPKPLEQGLEFQVVGNIPKVIMDSTVTKHWVEDDENRKTLCIIWDNRR